MKAIVFDFDGLIIDTETEWFYAFQEAMEQYGAAFPFEFFVTCIGTVDGRLEAFIGEQAGKENVEAICNLGRELHTKRMETVDIREGVKEYLAEAKELGLRIGLATSSRRVWPEMFLKKLGIRDYFEVLKTSDDVEKVKPDPALYLQAIEALGVNANEAIAFEDSAHGANAAIAAGLHCVIVPNEVTKDIAFEKFHLRINSMRDMSLAEVIAHIT
ncbi:HAD-IA family hydrolase [Paenibacillus sp. MMS18-CY102]|uniref:HAD-IA family hydrolase n=1 Tax=Paenibacillus sp. MMS18-CY102 TaxID=2682849 RepID=UPI0013665D0B|nr:HAD-IA family hydrolase [Paenibacillus sp. MMS18-CY102]